MKIKWKKIRNIIKKKYNKDINIFLLSTNNVSDDINAFTDKINNIYINGNNIKEDYDILKAVSHELTHILFPNEKDNTDEFESLMMEINKNLELEYRIK